MREDHPPSESYAREILARAITYLISGVLAGLLGALGTLIFSHIADVEPDQDSSSTQTELLTANNANLLKLEQALIKLESHYKSQSNSLQVLAEARVRESKQPNE